MSHLLHGAAEEGLQGSLEQQVPTGRDSEGQGGNLSCESDWDCLWTDVGGEA